MKYFRIRVLEISVDYGVHLVESVEEYTLMPEEYEKIKNFAESLEDEVEE